MECGRTAVFLCKPHRSFTNNKTVIVYEKCKCGRGEREINKLREGDARTETERLGESERERERKKQVRVYIQRLETTCLYGVTSLTKYQLSPYIFHRIIIVNNYKHTDNLHIQHPHKCSNFCALNSRYTITYGILRNVFFIQMTPHRLVGYTLLETVHGVLYMYISPAVIDRLNFEDTCKQV